MAFIRRASIKQKPVKGYRVAVVVSDDVDTDIVKTVDVEIPTIEGQPAPSTNFMKLPLRVVKENGNKRFVFADLEFSEDAVNFAYTLKGTMKDENDKSVGEPIEVQLDVIGDGDSRVRNATIRQINATQFRLRIVVIGDNEQDVDRVEIEFADFTGPAPLPEQLELTNPKVNGGKKIFIDKTLTFEEPVDAADQIYGTVIDLIGVGGEFLGSTEYSIVVEGLEE
ncbi:MAG: hypothetical protein ACRBFS_23765 [Aureispira sp.]